MLFKEILKEKNGDMLLKAFYKGDEAKPHLIEKNNAITEYVDENVAYIYLGEKSKFTWDNLVSTFKSVVASQKRSYLVDLKSFAAGQDNFCNGGAIKALTRAVYFAKAELFNEKTNKKEEEFTLLPYMNNVEAWIQDRFEKELVLAEAQNFVRNLQIMPPNVCNSEFLADYVAKDLAQYDNLKVTVLDKKAIEELKMGLLLSVNRGSMYEPRVVVIEYNGNPESKEKTVLVGKGITFDSGGYSLKGARHMLGMKFDMSGSAIVAGALKAIAQLKPKSNFAAVMCITDNRVNGDASLPDAVWKSMNGKTVEINNTDAEGRLVMADGLTYAVRKLNATRLVDVATLTGAMISALGTTYTGIWATSDKAWENLSNAAKEAHELVWRMPFDEAFAKNIRNSKVADLKNTDLSGNAGSSSAAMFLKEFTEDVEYIHCDVAGTAEINEEPQGILVRTLTELALQG